MVFEDSCFRFQGRKSGREYKMKEARMQEERIESAHERLTFSMVRTGFGSEITAPI
jgi:hypothetical protein